MTYVTVMATDVNCGTELMRHDGTQGNGRSIHWCARCSTDGERTNKDISGSRKTVPFNSRKEEKKFSKRKSTNTVFTEVILVAAYASKTCFNRKQKQSNR